MLSFYDCGKMKYLTTNSKFPAWLEYLETFSLGVCHTFRFYCADTITCILCGMNYPIGQDPRINID